MKIIALIQNIFLIALCCLLFVGCTNEAPLCKIISLEDGFEVLQGDSVEIVVSADDPDGIIMEVKLVINDSAIILEKNDEYTYLLNTTALPIDSFSILARSTDDRGDFAEDKITIHVKTKVSFTDERDGNVYQVVKIGNQVWMAENLKYLPTLNEYTENSFSEPYYYICGYKTNSGYTGQVDYFYTKYGVLYNWPASLHACPVGWHLSSDEEWKQLEMYIGMSQSEADDTGRRGTDEGDKLKANTGRFSDDNSTNEYGFSALPGGYRDFNVRFGHVGYSGNWWSTPENDSLTAWSRTLYYNYSGVGRYCNNKEHGFSVRCLRD